MAHLKDILNPCPSINTTGNFDSGSCQGQNSGDRSKTSDTGAPNIPHTPTTLANQWGTARKQDGTLMVGPGDHDG